MRLPARALGVVAAAALACNPPGTGGTAAGGTSTGSSGAGSTSTTSSGSTAADSPTTTGSTGASTGVPCEPEKPPECEPARQDMTLDFRLDAKGQYDDDFEDYVEACTVMNAVIELSDLALNFVCTGAENQVTVHEIRVTLDPPPLAPPLMPGEEATLRVHTDVFFEGHERHVAVHDGDGELVLAFVDARWLPGPEYFAPLTVARASVCPPACADASCGFILLDCPCDERLALDLKAGEELLLRVVDGNIGLREESPRYQMRVDKAYAWSGPADDPGACDHPGAYSRLLIVRVP